MGRAATRPRPRSTPPSPAALPDDQPYKAEQLRRAAGLHRKAGNPAAGLAMLAKAAAVPKLPDEVAGPVWAEYADGLLAANRPDEALGAFKRALDTVGPTSTAVRHKLARNLIDSRDPRKLPLGIELLEQIAKAERVSVPEQEYHEKALVELADEAIRVGEYQKAEARLRTQLRLYSNGPEAGQGKLLLGTALLQRIDPKAKALAPDAEKAGEEALGLLKQVIADVEARKVANRPAAGDAWLRTQANLRVLLAQVLLRKPYDVLTTADPLRREYTGRVEELIVLSMMYHGYLQLNQDNGRLTVEAQMREVFNRLKEKPGSFPARSGEYSREYWDRAWPSLTETPR
jgi:tetratricopeptide (TPR) repeat protein